MFRVSVFLFIVWCGFNSQDTVSAQISEFSELRLEISIAKRSFRQLEPIAINFKVSNPTDHPIVGHTAFNLTSNATVLLVRAENEKEVSFSGFSPTPKQVGLVTRPIKPGESVEVDNILDYPLMEIFPKPGVYRLRAKMTNWGKPGFAVSAPVTITVVAPEGTDKDAFDFILKTPNPDMFYTGDGNLGRSEKNWRQFLDRYPNCIYSDFVTFSLARHLFYRNEIGESAMLFGQLTEKTDFPYREKSLFFLSETKKKE